MENFTYKNPTVIHFGKGCIAELGNVINECGTKTLLVYGKGSVKKNGIYDTVIKELDNNAIKYFEYSGIKPNPIIEDVENIIALAKKEKTDSLLALGGGSVIDSVKVASLCIKENLDPWEVVTRKAKPTQIIPVICILTLAATGTEMNAAAVVQNHKTEEKIGFVNPLSYPKHSFLDPEFTYTVPKNYTAFGIVDLIAHALEAWFANGDSTLADRFIAAIIKEAMEIAPKVLAEPKNYEYRSKTMLAATCALNGTTSLGRKYSGDWGVHDIGHTLSYLYDTPHGASLSIAYPAWLKLHKERIPKRILKLGKCLFETTSINQTIKDLENFFKSVESPTRLSDINIGEDKHQEIVDFMIKNKVNGLVHELTSDDYVQLVQLMGK